mgnify:CR=1 FL=1
MIHKENGGLSDARNAGMPHASGEYIIFIDSDDYIESDMLEYMYTRLTEAGADMATCGSTRFTVTVLNNKKEEKDFGV